MCRWTICVCTLQSYLQNYKNVIFCSARYSCTNIDCYFFIVSSVRRQLGWNYCSKTSATLTITHHPPLDPPEAHSINNPGPLSVVEARHYLKECEAVGLWSIKSLPHVIWKRLNAPFLCPQFLNIWELPRLQTMYEQRRLSLDPTRGRNVGPKSPPRWCWGCFVMCPNFL